MRRRSQVMPRYVAEDGLSLVEMMAAILIIGLILAALAATLVGSLRQNVRSERQVVAAALHTESNERLQAAQWQNATLYHNELDQLAEFGLSSGDADPTFEGLPVATRPGYTDPADRVDEVPIPAEDVERSGIDFTVNRIIVWVDRDGDGVDDTKRFITIAQWEEFGQQKQTRFESERIPTAADLLAEADGLKVLQFDLGPSPTTLDATATTTQDISVVVRFSEGVALADVRFFRLDSSDALVASTASLTPVAADPEQPGTFVTWTGTLAAGAYRFPNGARNFTLHGQDPPQEITAVSTITFVGGPVDPIPDPDDPEPTPSPSPSPTPSPSPSDLSFTTGVQVNSSVCVKSNGRLNEPLSVRVGVAGIDSSQAWSVVVSFTDRSGQNNLNMSVVGGGTPSITGSTFEYAALRNASSPTFTPGSSTTFSVIASQGGSSIGPQVSGNVTFTRC